MTEQHGMYVHPAAMMVLVAVISVMLTIIVVNRPVVTSGEMATADARVTASADGLQLYYSTMHPWIVQDHPGTCPICGMDLVAMPADEQATYLANHAEFI